MTNNQLAPERISDISDYFVEMQDHYSDPADRENFEIFRDAELLMKELQERRKADSEPVVFTDERNLHHIAMGRETSLIWGKQNSEAGDVPLYRHAQPAPVVPVVPATLPCSVELKPGLIIGKGCKTETLLTALRRRADYNADIDAMTPEERAEHDASIKAFKAMLPQPAPVVPDDVSIFEAAIEECKTCDSIDEHAWNHGVLVVMAKYESCRAAMLQAGNSPVIGIDLASGPDRTVEVRYVAPPGYVMVPKEPTPEMMAVINEAIKSMRGSAATYARVLAAAQQEMMKDEANNLSPK